MFSSISKVWNEVSDETNESIHFSPIKRQVNQESKHHIRHDRQIRNPIERITNTNSTRRASSKVLKPSTNQKNNVFWGTLGKLGKVLSGVTDDENKTELGTMKRYMNSMIKDRSQTPDLEYRKNPHLSSSLQKRAERLNEKAEVFTQDNFTRNKRVRKLQREDLDFSDTSNESIGRSIHRTTRPLREKLLNSTSVGPRADLIEQKRTEKFKIYDIPSSPFEPVMKSTSTPSQRKEEDLSTEKIEELSAKVNQLETTIESLREELRLSNERSIQFENSMRNDTILKSEEFDKIEIFSPKESRSKGARESHHYSPLPLERPLSPVKIDLDKFRIVK